MSSRTRHLLAQAAALAVALYLAFAMTWTGFFIRDWTLPLAVAAGALVSMPLVIQLRHLAAQLVPDPAAEVLASTGRHQRAITR